MLCLGVYTAWCLNTAVAANIVLATVVSPARLTQHPVLPSLVLAGALVKARETIVNRAWLRAASQ